MENKIEDMTGRQYSDGEHTALGLDSLREQMESNQVNEILLQMQAEGAVQRGELLCSNH